MKLNKRTRRMGHPARCDSHDNRPKWKRIPGLKIETWGTHIPLCTFLASRILQYGIRAQKILRKLSLTPVAKATYIFSVMVSPA